MTIHDGDPNEADQSAALDALREDLEGKKHIIDRSFPGRDVTLTFQFISNRLTIHGLCCLDFHYRGYVTEDVYFEFKLLSWFYISEQKNHEIIIPYPASAPRARLVPRSANSLQSRWERESAKG